MSPIEHHRVVGGKLKASSKIELIAASQRAKLAEDTAGTALREGRPWPAGRVLDQALAEAGLDRRSTYLTNAVKHFKHEKCGKRRLHNPNSAGRWRNNSAGNSYQPTRNE